MPLSRIAASSISTGSITGTQIANNTIPIEEFANTGTTAVFSPSANTVVIRTANTERARVDSTGSFRIGNTGNGGTGPLSNGKFQMTSNGYNMFMGGQFVGADVSSNYFTLGNWGNSSSETRISSRGFISFRTGGATSEADGTEYMRMTSAGNVGIRVTDPSYALEVGGAFSGGTAGGAIRAPGQYYIKSENFAHNTLSTRKIRLEFQFPYPREHCVAFVDVSCHRFDNGGDYGMDRFALGLGIEGTISRWASRLSNYEYGTGNNRASMGSVSVLSSGVLSVEVTIPQNLVSFFTVSGTGPGASDVIFTQTQ
jgi:hypothetical protein